MFWESHWLQLEWTGILIDAHISIKELIPVVLVMALWGHLWTGKSIHVLSDNMASVAAINNHSSKDTGMGHFFCLLAFILAHFYCQLSAHHISGFHNTVSDALSHFISLCTPTGSNSHSIRTNAPVTTRGAKLGIISLDSAVE